MNCAYFLIVVFVSVYHVKCSNDWSYEGHNGPSFWSSLEGNTCGGNNQSPVNIIESSVIPDQGLKKLRFQNYDQSLNTLDLINNGHSIKLILNSNDKPMKMTDELNQTYTALQLHFHWTSENVPGGSEHTLNGKHFPIEMHIVHIKDPFKSLDDVKSIRDGLAVIGVFLQTDNSTEKSSYDDLLQTLPKFSGDKISVDTKVSLDDLLPHSSSYYRYYGSLTTPPCYEVVKWSVMKESVNVPAALLKKLQKNTFNSKQRNESNSSDKKYQEISGNFRPSQNLNKRIVTSFFERDILIDEKDHSWTYSDTSKTCKWLEMDDINEETDEHCKKCAGKEQSPIDIQTSIVKSNEKNLRELQFSTAFSKISNGTLSNNGHTIVYSLGQDDLTFSEGTRKYQALQLHFHWASATFSNLNKDFAYIGGSEHTVNNHHYPIEMHIVHKKLSGGTNDGRDALGVIGVLLEIAKDEDAETNVEDDELLKLTSRFQDISYSGLQHHIKVGPVLRKLIPDTLSYYRYMGSLTTPPCSESVLWTIIKSPLTISKNRFFEFQNLLRFSSESVQPDNNTQKTEKLLSSQTSLAGNFRPVQMLNGRTIYFYRSATSSWTTLFYVIAIMTSALILLGGFYACRKVFKKSTSDESNYTKGTVGSTDCMRLNDLQGVDERKVSSHEV